MVKVVVHSTRIEIMQKKMKKAGRPVKKMLVQ